MRPLPSVKKENYGTILLYDSHWLREPSPVLVAALTSFGATLVLTPLFILWARKFGIVFYREEKPLEMTVTAGGVPIFAGVLLGVIFALGFFRGAEELDFSITLLGFSGAVLLLGFIDDLYDISPWIKLLFQIGIIATWVKVSDVRVEYITHPFTGEPLSAPPVMGAFLAFLWVILLMNAWNLVDGIDGLATSLGIVSLTLLFLASGLGKSILPSVTAALLGGLLAFLPYNLPPARIYLGNAGSYTLGFVLGAITADTHLKAVLSFSFFTSLLLFAIPLGDLFYAVLRRFFGSPRGSFFQRLAAIVARDEEHIHHRLLKRFHSKHLALFVMVSTSLAFGVLGLFLNFLRNPKVARILLLAFLVLIPGVFLLLYWRLGTLRERNDQIE